MKYEIKIHFFKENVVENVIYKTADIFGITYLAIISVNLS